MRTTASAPGKVILCGEHAVVYNQPAIALPLPDVRATATVEDTPDNGVVIRLLNLDEQLIVDETLDHPLATLVRLLLDRGGRTTFSNLEITLQSQIPIASGMGSGAALGAAFVRALATHLAMSLSNAEIAALVYESERFFHGTPSGIDNTVVSYEQAIWFVRGQPTATPPVPPTIEPIRLGRPISLVIADTGVRAPTHITVGGVRERRQRDESRYESLFAEIGAICRRVRDLLEAGHVEEIGPALNRNHELLRDIGVSSPELERLTEAARQAGAHGAKLSGGGGGGIMLALVDDSGQEMVARALLDAGATHVMTTIVT